VQAKQKNMFFRPDDVDPVEHAQYCLNYLSSLSECCRMSELYYKPSTMEQKAYIDFNSMGKIIELPKFNYIAPTKARSCNYLNCSSSLTVLPAVAVTDAVADCQPDSQYFPVLESSCDVTDQNQNVMGRRKRLLLPLPSENVISAKVATDDGGDGDFELRPSAGCSHPATKKQPAGRERCKNLTAEGRGKSQSSRGRAAIRGKKEETANESKRSKKPRKAKDSANNQMKLQFFGSPTTRQSHYDDAFADDIYTFGSSSSPETKVTTSCVYSRQKDKKIAGAGSDCIPTLAQRIGNSIKQSPVLQRQFDVKHLSAYAGGIIKPFESSSQRSSRLFDDMMEQQAQVIPREHDSQSVTETGHRLSHVVEASTHKENESIPRYFYFYYYCIKC